MLTTSVLHHPATAAAITKPDCTEDTCSTSDPTRSAAMLINVENRIRRREQQFGHNRLLRAMAKIHPDELSQHVDRYRVLVRSNEWPNEPETTNLAEFLNDFERGCYAYVDVGFKALEYLDGKSELPLPYLYLQVVASEALRGQYGKRSPSGLDARLDLYEATMTQVLGEALGGEAERALDLLCVPGPPHQTAESALLEDFAQVRSVFPEPPTIDDVLEAAPATQEVVWTFLRRHVRWSVHHLRNYYQQLGTDLLQDRLDVARKRRRELAIQRTELIANISERCSATLRTRILEIATAITALNHINLALEPSFSFKGGVGLAHGLIFGLVQTSGQISNLTQRDIAYEKWALRSKTSCDRMEVTSDVQITT